MHTKHMIVQDRQRTWGGRDYIVDDPDTTFSDPADELSEAESFNEDDMYGLDDSMMVMSDSSNNGEEVDMSDRSSDGEEVELFGPTENVSNMHCIIIMSL